MLKQAYIKFKSLIYDDSGVATAYTIMVFLFFFMLCVSTYAMAENIRQKMELQNACDAAAYSGAVVQADMLSRIAVLNRALSWTYAQTNMRQMDYIVDRWLQDIHEAYDGKDGSKGIRDIANELNKGNCLHGGHSNMNGATCRYDNQFAWIAGCRIDGKWYAEHIDLNGTPIPADSINLAMRRAFPGEGTNISNGLKNIAVINKEIIWIKENINQAISNAINFSLQNVSGDFAYYTDGRWNNLESATYIVPQSREEDFLNYAGATRLGTFERGYDGGWWWQLVSTPGADFDSGGFARNYRQGSTALIARTAAQSFVHNDDPYTNSCSCTMVYNPSIPRYGSGVDTKAATPARLTPAFFGRAGSIVVTAKRSMINPFSVIFGDFEADKGLYAAFNEGVERNMHIWTVSAARAGVRLGSGFEGGDAPGFYRILYPGPTFFSEKYTNGVWNLCEEDWDAVMIPIDRALNNTVSPGTWGADANGNSTKNSDTNALFSGARTALSGVNSNYGTTGNYTTPSNPMRH